jgi:predicted nucleic acid-binding protein
MRQRFYVDTNIWLDLHLNRRDKFRPLGEWAFEFLNQAYHNGDEILYSDGVFMELLRVIDEEECMGLLKDFEARKVAQISGEQRREAEKLCSVRSLPLWDVLHAILARDNNAVMVTRDAHFLELMDLVEIKKPEDLL